MDSQRFNHWNGGYDHQKNTENNVDLTLKLGLPNDHDHDHDQPQFEQYFRSATVLKNHQPANYLNFNAPYTQGSNHHEMANEGGNAGLNHQGMLTHGGGGEAGMNHHGMLIGGNLHGSWPQEIMGNHPHYMNTNGSVVGFPAYPNSYASFNSDPGNFPTPPMNGPNTMPRNIDHGQIGSSSGSQRRGSRHQREGSNIGLNKRCSNPCCNTDDTPMWRKGPHGPKTLCNACGIKYRKEEEKKRAREAAKKANGNE
ncbi:unnamed protein product [Dovyalis caffra]|uniref:GATA-type domain-containing protein n=1 Tax=Dovyalis caffra TaxID=77055 RepID=A0AAV1RRA4_9ROSI|nr:unnamed protein product [Dovyalis caffra]